MDFLWLYISRVCALFVYLLVKVLPLITCYSNCTPPCRRFLSWAFLFLTGCADLSLNGSEVHVSHGGKLVDETDEDHHDMMNG